MISSPGNSIENTRCPVNVRVGGNIRVPADCEIKSLSGDSSEKKTRSPDTPFALNNATSPNFPHPVCAGSLGRLPPKCPLSAICARRRARSQPSPDSFLALSPRYFLRYSRVILR